MSFVHVFFSFCFLFFFFFKQKTAYEMRISDWSSDVCSSDLKMHQGHRGANHPVKRLDDGRVEITSMNHGFAVEAATLPENAQATHVRSEEHTSELQSLMRISYAVFCLKKKNKNNTETREISYDFIIDDMYE